MTASATEEPKTTKVNTKSTTVPPTTATPLIATVANVIGE